MQLLEAISFMYINHVIRWFARRLVRKRVKTGRHDQADGTDQASERRGEHEDVGIPRLLTGYKHILASCR